jgi:hypothetical protein
VGHLQQVFCSVNDYLTAAFQLPQMERAPGDGNPSMSRGSSPTLAPCCQYGIVLTGFESVSLALSNKVSVPVASTSPHDPSGLCVRRERRDKRISWRLSLAQRFWVDTLLVSRRRSSGARHQLVSPHPAPLCLARQTKCILWIWRFHPRCPRTQFRAVFHPSCFPLPVLFETNEGGGGR